MGRAACTCQIRVLAWSVQWQAQLPPERAEKETTSRQPPSPPSPASVASSSSSPALSSADVHLLSSALAPSVPSAAPKPTASPPPLQSDSASPPPAVYLSVPFAPMPSAAASSLPAQPDPLEAFASQQSDQPTVDSTKDPTAPLNIPAMPDLPPTQQPSAPTPIAAQMSSRVYRMWSHEERAALLASVLKYRTKQNQDKPPWARIVNDLLYSPWRQDRSRESITKQWQQMMKPEPKVAGMYIPEGEPPASEIATRAISGDRSMQREKREQQQSQHRRQSAAALEVEGVCGRYPGR